MPIIVGVISAAYGWGVGNSSLMSCCTQQQSRKGCSLVRLCNRTE